MIYNLTAPRVKFSNPLAHSDAILGLLKYGDTFNKPVDVIYAESNNSWALPLLDSICSPPKLAHVEVFEVHNSYLRIIYLLRLIPYWADTVGREVCLVLRNAHVNKQASIKSDW